MYRWYVHVSVCERDSKSDGEKLNMELSIIYEICGIRNCLIKMVSTWIEIDHRIHWATAECKCLEFLSKSLKHTLSSELWYKPCWCRFLSWLADIDHGKSAKIIPSMFQLKMIHFFKKYFKASATSWVHYLQ